MLEYYAGILFLTTNRIGDFDEAFASRIHLSLHYPPLSRDNTTRVVDLNLSMIDKRFKTQGRLIDIETKSILAFAERYWEAYEKARWNGRQIRNACLTALALSENEFEEARLKGQGPEKVLLRLSHFKIVAKAYLRFTKYLKAIYGSDEDVRASEWGLRALEQAFKKAKVTGAGAGGTTGEVGSTGGISDMELEDPEEEYDGHGEGGEESWVDEDERPKKATKAARSGGKQKTKKAAAGVKPRLNELRKLEAKKNGQKGGITRSR